MSVRLPRGAWSLKATVEGFWARPEALGVRAPTTVTLKLLPAARLRGQVAAPAGLRPPATLWVGFQPASDAGPDAPRGSIECPIRSGGWSCELPIGSYDLQRHVPGFATRYDWAVRLERGRVVDLGRLLLEPGPSVVGWVEAESAGQAVADLIPNESDTGTASLRLSTLRANVNAHGFFQFVKLKPGSYQVIARAGDRQSPAADVTVAGSRETRLDEPLALAAAGRLTVKIDPPQDPEGRRWTIRLDSLRGRRFTTVSEGIRVSEQGEWLPRSIMQGRYVLSVIGEDQQTWWSEDVEVASDTQLEIHLPIVALQGTVSLGERAVPAQIAFQGFHGEAVTFQANRDGEFSGRLPHPGSWDITVSLDEPKAERGMRNVEIDGGESGIATLHLKLPDTVVRGLVVRGDGRPPDRALVRAAPGGGAEFPASIQSQPDGRFELHGLPPGPATFAADGEGLVSRPVKVTIPGDDTPLDGVRLVLRDPVVIAGQIVSDDGPVAEAQVLAHPLPSSVLAGGRFTDSEGHFSLRVPAGTSEVSLSVLAEGYSLFLSRLTIAHEDMLVIHLAREGGTLTLELPEGKAADQGFALHDGAFAGFPGLRGWAHRQGIDTGVVTPLVVPQMPPGEYTVCLGTPADLDRMVAGGPAAGARCASGRLSPSGQLTLRPGP
jgi:hypothetical protein